MDNQFCIANWTQPNVPLILCIRFGLSWNAACWHSSTNFCTVAVKPPHPLAASPSFHMNSSSECHLMSCAHTLERIHLNCYWDEFQHSCLNVERTDMFALILWPTCTIAETSDFIGIRSTALLGSQKLHTTYSCVNDVPTKMCNNTTQNPPRQKTPPMNAFVLQLSFETCMPRTT